MTDEQDTPSRGWRIDLPPIEEVGASEIPVTPKRRTIRQVPWSDGSSMLNLLPEEGIEFAPPAPTVKEYPPSAKLGPAELSWERANTVVEDNPYITEDELKALKINRRAVLRYHVGYHVSGWGVVVPDKGDKQTAIWRIFFPPFCYVGSPKVKVERVTACFAGILSDGERMMSISKPVGSGLRSVNASVLVFVRSNEAGDLEAGWLLFERSAWAVIKWVIVAIGIFYLSTLLESAVYQFVVEPQWQICIQYDYCAPYFQLQGLWWLDARIWGGLIAAYFLGRGLGWWGRLYRRSPAQPSERIRSVILATYVDTALKYALQQNGIDAKEMRELDFREESWIEYQKDPRPRYQ